MTKKTFYPKMKDDFLYNTTIVTVLLSIIPITVLIFGNMYPLFARLSISALFFVPVIYYYYIFKPTKLDKLEKGGYSKITIDSKSRTITFDNKHKINMDEIDNCEFQFRRNPIFNNRYLMTAIDGELNFYMQDGGKYFIQVQFLKHVKELEKNLKKNKIKVLLPENSIFYEADSHHKTYWKVMIIVFVITFILAIWNSFIEF